MSAATMNHPPHTFQLMSRVTVKCPISIGCRPRTRPEGVVIERSTAGLYRVQFEDGSKRWFLEQELCVS